MKRKLNKPSHRKLVVPYKPLILSPLTDEEKKCYKSIAYQAKAMSFNDFIGGFPYRKDNYYEETKE